jgi:NAD(P)-dependent dehydrogenase (short-subunit alcohol dehydrogenase family)
VTGDGADTGPAARVAKEITDLGGEAIENTNSVASPEGGRAIVQSAIDAFGQIDIVVNNAGILRDKTFQNMTAEFVEPVLDVHLKGAFFVTQPAWVHMREQRYGRIVNTSSGAGLFGNFGQANYGAAKMGLVGLTHVLAIEGGRYNIQANAIAPVARTRMTEEVLGGLAEAVDPKFVSPLLAWLCHEDCSTTGHIYTVGGGRVARLFVGMTAGWARTDGLTIEDVRDHFDEIEDPSSFQIPAGGMTDDLAALRHALAVQNDNSL